MLVTVMAYVPGGADSPAATTIRAARTPPAATTIRAVPPVATAAGARATVTPVGIPLTDRPTGGPAGAQAVKAARID
jgi:hypothetical protein